MTLMGEIRTYRGVFREEPCFPCKRLNIVCCTEPRFGEDNARTKVVVVDGPQQAQSQSAQSQSAQHPPPPNQNKHSRNAPDEERARPANSVLLHSRSSAWPHFTFQKRTGRRGRLAGSQPLLAQSIMTHRGASMGIPGQTVQGRASVREESTQESQSPPTHPSQIQHSKARQAQAEEFQVDSLQKQPSQSNRRAPGLQALQAQLDRAQPPQGHTAQVQKSRDSPPQDKASHGREHAHGSDPQVRDDTPGRPPSFTRGNDLPLTAIPDDVPRRSWERRRSSRQSSLYSRQSQSMEELPSQRPVEKLPVPSRLPNTGDIRGGGNLKIRNDSTFHGRKIPSVLSRTASRLNDIRTRSVTNLSLRRRSSVIFSRQPHRHRLPIGVFAPARPTDGNVRLFPEPTVSSCIQHREKEETRASGLVEAIQARDRAYSSLSTYSADSLSMNVSACSDDRRLSSETAPTEVSDDGAKLGGAVSSSTRPDALDPAPHNGATTKDCTGTSHGMVQGAKGQNCEAAARGSVSAYGLPPPRPRQSIKRKMLPESNKVEDVPPKTVELSEDGEQFSKELELRFALSGTIEISNERLPVPSPCSSSTSSLEKSLALELLCYPSYDKEVAVVEAPRHLNIRETFQDIVASSNSMRWLRSVGKGRKKFSRPPIPNF